MGKISVLDCTLRDGAYIVNSMFGDSAIRGVISKLQEARVEIIECGWLKDKEHVAGSSYYRYPSDLQEYIVEKKNNNEYVLMIDWDRYDVEALPLNDNKFIDAIRVVFPHEHYIDGIEVGKKIIQKGYKVYYQVANTLAYSYDELISLANIINEVNPAGVSIVDTFGTMYEEDLDRIVSCLDEVLHSKIQLGFHSHNNQQMAYANAVHFIRLLENSKRDCVVDASLSGMGRGAGNATTELVVNYLNCKRNANYNLDAIMDAIDFYINVFSQKYDWGYSTSYYIAGIYGCHVNNIAYLNDNHRTNFHDMRNIIESLDPGDRLKYDYDLLEQKYIENQDRKVDDSRAVDALKGSLFENGNMRKVLLVAPGKSSLIQYDKIKLFIDSEKPLLIAVNALLPKYTYDFIFLTNSARYEYAKMAYPNQFDNTAKIILSNIKRKSDSMKEYIVNYNRAIKRGWLHFDNSVICALRLLEELGTKEVYLSGFDGFSNVYNESYADENLPTLNPGNEWDKLNVEIKEMFDDVVSTTKLDIHFLTDSLYEK